MPALANANRRDRVIRALQRAGFEVHQGANHVVMVHGETKRRAVIPRHPTVKPNLLRAILKECGVSEREYLELYR